MTIDERIKTKYLKVFHDWIIVGDMIGRGSQGKTAVYRIEKENTGFTETGALKIINVFEATDNGGEETEKIDREIAEVRKQAETELAAMNRMKGHPNIVSYHEFQFEEYRDGSRRGADLLIRMDFLENVGKKEKEGVSYPEKEIIRMGLDLSRALTECHKRGILHRDIKPDNIFQNDYGYLLGDFGIAKYSEETELVASTIAGSYPYAAPELFRLGPAIVKGKYDKRVDIYALGLSLYELANANKIPFASSTYKRPEDIKKRLDGMALPAPSGAGERLSGIILKACAFRPEDRFQDAEEMARSLEELMLELSRPKEAGPTPQGEKEAAAKSAEAGVPAVSEETVAAVPDFIRVAKEAEKTGQESLHSPSRNTSKGNIPWVPIALILAAVVVIFVISLLSSDSTEPTEEPKAEETVSEEPNTGGTEDGEVTEEEKASDEQLTAENASGEYPEKTAVEGSAEDTTQEAQTEIEASAGEDTSGNEETGEVQEAGEDLTPQVVETPSGTRKTAVNASALPDKKESEPNEKFVNATTIYPGKLVSSRLSSEIDVDYYKCHVEAPCTVLVELYSPTVEHAELTELEAIAETRTGNGSVIDTYRLLPADQAGDYPWSGEDLVGGKRIAFETDKDDLSIRIGAAEGVTGIYDLQYIFKVRVLR